MSLTLHIAADQWRGRVRRYVQDASAAGVTVVPVTKGNGYGFGNAVLAAEAARLGVATLAVGTYDELPAVGPEFGGDLLVLSPWRPWLAGAVGDDRVVHTVSRLEDLRQLAAGAARPRVVVEVLTSMRRHGIDPGELAETAKLLDDVRFEGFALHLPLAGDHTAEATTLARRAFEAVPTAARTVWASHLGAERAAAVGRDTDAEVRLRVATALWLGDRSGLTPGRRCWTCTGCGAARRTATGSAGPAATAPSWWSRAARRTGWRCRPRSRRARCGSGRRRWPAAGWRRADGRCRPSASPASSAGSPSRRTCSAR